MNQRVVGAFYTTTSYLTLTQVQVENGVSLLPSTQHLEVLSPHSLYTLAPEQPGAKAPVLRNIKMPFQARHTGLWDCVGDETQSPHFTRRRLSPKLQDPRGFQNQNNRKVRPGKDHQDQQAKETGLVKVMGGRRRGERRT